MEKELAINKKWKPVGRWIKSVRVDLKNKTTENEYYTPQSPEEEKQLWDDYNKKIHETIDLVLNDIESDKENKESAGRPSLSDKEYRNGLRREKFMRTYPDLPLALRQKTILVLDRAGPITWNVAFTEVEGKTPISEEILKKLEKLKMI